MKSNKIVVVLGGESTTGSGLAVSYARNINTMYLNSHLYNEFVVRPQFELGTAETMWVTFTRKGATKPLKTLLMAARKKTEDVVQVVDGTSSTTEKTSYDGWEYYLRLPDAITLWAGAWQFSFTIAELPYVVKYKGTVDTTDDLPASGNAIGDTYFVGEEDKYYVWSGTAWGELTVTAVSTSDVGEFTVNASVSAPLGAPTDLDIQVMYSQIVDMLQNTQNYLPKIGDNGNWQTYTSSGYVDSGVRADGTQMFTVTSGTTITTASNQLVAVSAIVANKTGQKIQIGDFIVATVADTERLGLLRIKGFNAAADKVFGGFEGYITGEKGADGADGAKGDTGVGVQSVTSENVTGGEKVSITLTDGTVSEFVIETDTIFGGISAIDFPYGTPTLTYDTTDGLHIHGVFRLTVNGTNYDVPFDQELPIVFGDGLTADVAQDGESVGVKVNGTVFRTSGGTISGNVTIGGNLTVQGTTTTVDSQHLKVKDKLIIVADGNTVKLTSPAGLLAPKYDGTNNGALVFDGDGTAYVGDVVLTEDGEIDVTASDLQPLATRGTLVNGNLVQWNGTALRLEDSGKKVADFASKDDVAKASGLLYLQSYESGSDPTVGQVLTLTNANFSHTPQVGDKFQLLEVVNMLQSWESILEVLTVGAATCTAKILATTNITGAAWQSAKDYTDSKVSTAEAYHIDLTGSSGTITQEQFDSLKADETSYIINTAVDSTTSNKYNRANTTDSATGTETALTYTYINGANLYRISIRANLSWVSGVYPAELMQNKSTTISTSSTDTQYPSAKAAYTYGQSVLTEAKAYADEILGAEQTWLTKIDSGEGV